jgi:uncharacterized membrane protein YeaQ/YmgE (transglycosylase-associated protein family)
MTIVWTIIIGFFIGLISRTFTPQRDTLGLVIFVLLGIAGAFIGGAVARVLGLCPDGRVVCLALSTAGSLQSQRQARSRSAGVGPQRIT